MYERGKVPRALTLTHPDTCQTSLDMFRGSSYSDDFTMVQIDTPELRRVHGGRAALQQVGEEPNLPFGASKWTEGDPTQDLVSLGIGFDVTDPERHLVYGIRDRCKRRRGSLPVAMPGRQVVGPSV
jgi:hypothetical protein